MKLFSFFLLIALYPVFAFSNQPFGVDKIRIVLDAKQQKVFDRNHAAASGEAFDASIQFGDENEALPIRAHIRGQGTKYRCDRKSLSLNLSEGGRHELFVGSDVGGIFLLSMCQDRLYLRTNTIFTLWRETGFFPFRFRLIELQVNQQTRGLYMMLEKPVDALLKKNAGLTAVLRRRFFPPDDFVEAKYSQSTKNTAVGDYVNAFLGIESLTGSTQVKALETVLDIEHFLRHLAVATAFRNGDYVDEVWFYRTPGGKIQYQGSGRYKTIKWDPEDVMGRCHYGGAYAWKDPSNIAHCAESKLSKMVLSNSQMYASFIAMLEQLIGVELVPKRFNEAIDETVRLLIKKINRVEIVQVMEQFEQDHENVAVSVSLMEAHEQIRQEAERLKKAYEYRIHALRIRIRHYHSRLPNMSE